MNINDSYKIAIPSYKRYDTIKNKTLKLLNEYNIDKKKITIFVANNEEKKLYKKSIGDQYKIVTGEDYNLCKDIREAGFTIMLNTELRLGNSVNIVI